MQKKLIAVAVAGALGVPAVAFAQTSTVTISGRAYLEYGHVSQGAGAATFNNNGPTNRTNVDFLQAPGSNISIQGEEKLGGGLSAWYKCESTADIRGQSQNGWCGRNSAVGLKGAFGSVFAGVWDTPFKRVQEPVGGGDTGFWGTAQLLTGDSTTVGDGASPGVFKRRQRNSINYDSPVFSGFQVMASTSSINSASAQTQSAANSKPRIWSLAGTYKNGPLNIYGAYERHNEFYSNEVTLRLARVNPQATSAATPIQTLRLPSAANMSGDERGYVIGASYTFGGKIKVGGLYTRQKWNAPPDTANVDGTSAKVSAWHVGVDWKVAGPHSIRVAYTKAGDVKGVGSIASAATGATPNPERPEAGTDSGAKSFQARYTYAFSKRTDVSVGFNRLKNDLNAGYNIFGPESNGDGAKHTAYGMSIDHRF